MTLAEIDARLAEIEEELEVCRAATPGPWTRATSQGEYIHSSDVTDAAAVAGPRSAHAADAEFVILARDGYPRALENERALLRALKAALKSCLAIPSMHHPVAFAHGFWGALSAEKKSAETEVQP